MAGKIQEVKNSLPKVCPLITVCHIDGADYYQKICTTNKWKCCPRAEAYFKQRGKKIEG